MQTSEMPRLVDMSRHVWVVEPATRVIRSHQAVSHTVWMSVNSRVAEPDPFKNMLHARRSSYSLHSIRGGIYSYFVTVV